MSGTPEGARKRIERIKKERGEDFLRESAMKAAKAPGKARGFASEKVGKDGLTGRQRASLVGKKGGQNTPGNFKNDPDRAQKLAKGRWQKGTDDDNSQTEG